MSRLSRGRKPALSIYKRLQEKLPDPSPLPILTHGGKLSQQLHAQGERITNPRLGRVRVSQETLRLSAALQGSYSLSANQLGLPMSIMTVHKNIPYGKWICDEAMRLNN